MEYVYLGKIVNTHGIKGEIRLISDFEKKNLVFKENFPIYIGAKKEEKLINSYRRHKNYDMITLKGINDINDVLQYKGEKVYINRNDLNLTKTDYLLEDLINMNIICHKKNYGKVIDIRDNKSSILLYIEYDKNYYIPMVEEYIKNVDIVKKEIEAERIEELL